MPFAIYRSGECDSRKSVIESTDVAVPAEVATAIEAEAEAAAVAVRTRRRVDALLAVLVLRAEVVEPEAAAHLTRLEYARRCSVSTATVTRWEHEGMPTIPVGSTYRIDPVTADEWRRARGRAPTTPAQRAPRDADDGLDVSAALARSGLRAIGGAR